MSSSSSSSCVESNNPKRKNQKNKKPAKQEIDLIKLRETIIKQANYIRQLKYEGVEPKSTLPHVQQLLDLKFLDPQNDEVTEPKCIKIRWDVPVKKEFQITPSSSS